VNCDRLSVAIVAKGKPNYVNSICVVSDCHRIVVYDSDSLSLGSNPSRATYYRGTT